MAAAPHPRLRLRQPRRRPPGGARGDRGGERGPRGLLRRRPLDRARRGAASASTSAPTRAPSSSSTAPAPTSRRSPRSPRPFEAVICTDVAHMHVDECGAPEQLAGVKLLPVADPDGKLAPERRRAAGRPSAATSTTCSRGSSRSPRRPSSAPSTRSTRSARSPTPRTSSACTCTSTAPGSPTRPPRSASRSRELTTEAGVDVVSFGGTKNGLVFGEAVVFCTPELAARLRVHPQAARPARLEDALRLGPVRGAAQRRAVAAQRRARQRDGPPARGRRRRRSTASRSLYPVEANGVFARLPRAAIDRLLAELPGEHPFYIWDDARRRGALDVLLGHDARPTSTRSPTACARPSPPRRARGCGSGACPAPACAR